MRSSLALWRAYSPSAHPSAAAAPPSVHRISSGVDSDFVVKVCVDSDVGVEVQMLEVRLS